VSQTLDHHTGKPVTNVVAGDDHSTIIFEDDSTINVPGPISSDVIGQILLLVEGDNPPTLVFGYPQAEDSTIVRTAEIPVPIDPVTMQLREGGEKMSATEEPNGEPGAEEEPAAEPGAEPAAEPAEEPAADDAPGGDDEPPKADDAAS